MINKLIILLLIVGVCYASDPSVSLTEFGGGLNTNSSVLLLKSNQGSQCLNLDIGRGYLQKRKGFLQLLPTGAWPAGDTTAGDDPITGLFSIRRSDDQRRLIGVISDSTPSANTDLDGVGWLVASPSYPQIVPGSGSYYYFKEGDLWRYYKYIYQGETPFWTYWNDRVYMSNGRQRPLVFYPYKFGSSDGYARELVPLTPGEPLIVPMEGAGNLNGEYYYMIGHSSACGSALGADEVKNGNFETWAADTLTYWDTLYATTGHFTVSTDTVKNGAKALRLRSRFGSREDGIRQTVRAKHDSTYELSVWFNRKTSYGGEFQVCAFDTVDGNYITGFSNYEATTGWIRNICYFTPPRARDSVELYIWFRTLNYDYKDTIYVDSVTLKQVRYKRHGVVTKPVIAQNENVLMTHFGWQTLADTCSYGSAAFDAMILDIYRTKANPGEITLEDDFYLTKSISLTAKAQVDTLHYRDTIPDDTLGYSGYTTIIHIDTMMAGRDSTGTLNGIRVGAPTYISANDGVHGANYIFTTPIADSEFVNKISYICTYYDTLINAESDSSRSLHVYHKFAVDSVYKIGLPPLPGGMNHMTRRIYKSYSYVVGHLEDSIASIKETTIRLWNGYAGAYDSEWKLKNMWEPREFIEDIQNNHLEIYIRPDYSPPSTSENWNTWLSYYIKYYAVVAGKDTIYDTTATPYKLIGEIKGTDSVFVDSIGFDSTRHGKHYWKSEAPYNLNHITCFEDRLWGAVGSMLYWSYLDSGGSWGSYRALALDVEDEITAILPKRDYIKVYLNKSQYAVYLGNDFEYERREIVKGIGCIAPRTALSYQDEIFYLSEQGLIRETGSVYRDRGSDFGIISEPINNILMNRTMSQLRSAVGFVHNDKYWLSIPSADTTFIYSLLTGGWSIYNYSFAQACLYDTAAVNAGKSTPSGDMLFINGDNDLLYKADTTATDNGTTISTKFRSAPFAVAPDYMTVNKFGIWRQSNDGSGGVDVRLYNAESDSIFYKYVNSIATRYDIYRSNSDASNYFQIDISDTTLDSLAIDRIDLWLERIGDQPEN